MVMWPVACDCIDPQTHNSQCSSQHDHLQCIAGILCHMACRCRFQCILEYVEKPLSKLTADIGAVLAKAPCSRHIFHMHLDPPAAPAIFPAQAENLTAANGAAHQHSESGPEQQKATTAEARYGVGNSDSRVAALAEPLQDMQHVTAGMHLSMFDQAAVQVLLLYVCCLFHHLEDWLHVLHQPQDYS